MLLIFIASANSRSRICCTSLIDLLFPPYGRSSKCYLENSIVAPWKENLSDIFRSRGPSSDIVESITSNKVITWVKRCYPDLTELDNPKVGLSTLYGVDGEIDPHIKHFNCLLAALQENKTMWSVQGRRSDVIFSRSQAIISFAVI